MKLQISLLFYLYITLFIFLPISCILVIFFSFFPSSSSPSFYSPSSFYSLTFSYSSLYSSASSSSSSSRESSSSSSPSFLFFFFHLIGWSRNWYIRYPQLRSPSSSSSMYSSCEYPSRCFVCLYFILPNWWVIMWVITSVRNTCLKRWILPGRFSYNSSSDGTATWAGTECSSSWPRISSSELQRSSSCCRASNRSVREIYWSGKEAGVMRASTAFTGVLSRRDKWMHEFLESSTTFISCSPNFLQYFTCLFVMVSTSSAYFLLYLGLGAPSKVSSLSMRRTSCFARQILGGIDESTWSYRYLFNFLRVLSSSSPSIHSAGTLPTKCTSLELSTFEVRTIYIFLSSHDSRIFSLYLFV